MCPNVNKKKEIMKTDLIIAGVGGQGILTIASIIGHAALQLGLHVKQAEVHGMSQRGGDVQSHLRISDAKIASDLIPKGQADLILAMEPLESLRYLPYLKKDGLVVTNVNPFVNIPNYPDIATVIDALNTLTNKALLDLEAQTKVVGNARTANIIMLGAATPFLPINYKAVESEVEKFFEKKGEQVVEVNLKALRLGRGKCASVINQNGNSF
jgi:indolepyruvate ferredoxin oxidoreductase beta subunit